MGSSRHLPGDERGQTLGLAVILMMVASMVVSSVLVFTSTMLLGQFRTEKNVEALLAADAGLEAVMSDLVRGADAVTTTYPVPVVSANGYTPTITVGTPLTTSGPAPTFQYIDPGYQDPDFATVATSSGYLVHLYNLPASTATFTNVLQVNWAYNPAAATRIGIWKDVITYKLAGLITTYPTEHPILDTGRSRGNETFNQTNLVVLDTIPGIYSIIFWNPSGSSARTTSPFKPSGSVADSWIYTSSFRDYTITSTVEGTSVQAYVRQTPGPMSPPIGDWSRTNTSLVTQTVTVQSLYRE